MYMPVYDSLFDQAYCTPWQVHSVNKISRYFLPPGVEAKGHFLSDKTQWPSPVAVVHHSGSIFPYWYYYIFFGLLVAFALFRFYYPESFRMMIDYLTKPLYANDKENNEHPGFFIVFSQFIAYLIDLGLLLFIVNDKWHWVRVHEQTFFNGFLFWSIVVLMYFILNQLLTIIIGFLFHTFPETSVHVKLNAYTAYTQAVFLTPILFIYLYTGWVFLLYLAVFVPLILIVLKWLQVIRIGLSGAGYTVFHLFLYLCMLEIIPVLLLIKVAILQA